ncbi:ATP-binding cassette domain-containing protein [Streptomyces sp. MP131-18]|uniref:ABC transporter ATP-binding protein n=1 Tax=Streptomyces sp. MP131-18 TaxID=1857892 RepID=UPI00097BCC1E|nr:ATP-binding cassette domain-containing protein [Streptomyces sp. MP131-18]
MRLQGVGRRYGPRGRWVLRDVGLHVPPGALLRIEGANGCGKSTLLRLVAGADAPSRGRITGRPRRVAYVPDRFPPALPLTALGYLTRLGRIHGLGRRGAAAAADAWLARFAAEEHAGTPLRELSKGSCQKVAVAQAFLAGPELLVLDEAWTGLDRQARRVLDEAVAERVAAGARVVVVDHSPARPAGVGARVYRVEDGRLCDAPAAGRETLVRAVGPPGAVPPDGLPGAPRWRRDAGGYALTVPAEHSDELLRALLGAQPPWHIERLETRP